MESYLAAIEPKHAFLVPSVLRLKWCYELLLGFVMDRTFHGFRQHEL